MSARVIEVDAAAAIVGIDHARLFVTGVGPERMASRLDAAEDRYRDGVERTPGRRAPDCSGYLLNSDQPRYHGKGMRLRAIGYAGGLLVVPLAWRALGRREPYPRELDLAVTLPLLVDAGGNAIGIYRRAHVDDLIHFADGALVASVVGALATPRVRTSWEAAAVGTAAGGAAAGLWEIGEWIGLKLGAKGMNLSYDDTMTDLIETMAGAALGGVITLLRHPSRLRRVPGGSGDPLVEPRSEG